ncbi:excisionase family protein [Minicystis rosea]|nr:excisionase family protein [Minicystis rosea]
MLITTKDVAALLHVHPKHVYRLLKRGLPAHRVGDEWRFDEMEVRRWARDRSRAHAAPMATTALPTTTATLPTTAPPLLAANGDVAIELLLEEAESHGAPLVGLVQTDHQGGIDLLRRGAVLIAGCHGDELPPALADLDLARIHLAQRELGLVFRRGARIHRASAIAGRRVALRPPTAGIRAILDEALRREGTNPEDAYASARLYRSHRDAAMAVVREEADVGLASRAWALRAGLGFLPLAAEAYALVTRASALADPRVAALCEAAQSAAFRKKLRDEVGYEVRRAGEIKLHVPVESRGHL